MNWPIELSPDVPRDEPARLINPALWSYWLSIGQSADLSEAEIIQRLDHMNLFVFEIEGERRLYWRGLEETPAEAEKAIRAAGFTPIFVERVN